MKLHEDVLNTLPYDYKPYVNLNDENLQDKINRMIRSGDIILICGIILSIALPCLIYYELEKTIEGIHLTQVVFLTMISLLISVWATYFVNGGHEAFMERLQPLEDFAVLKDKAESLKRLNSAANQWAVEKEALGRSLRVFDLDIMQSLKEVSEYYEEKNLNYRNKKLSNYKNSTHVYFS